MVGTDALDDGVAVMRACTLSAPADQAAVVSPVTTLVQSTIASTGASFTDATKAVRDAIGITASLFADYTNTTATPAPTGGSPNPATLARLVVLASQQQTAAIPGTVVGSTAIDASIITQAQVDAAIQRKLLELLPDLAAALADPAVLAATTTAARDAALLAAATTIVADSGLTAAAQPTVVAINTQTSTSTPVVATTPAPTVQLHTLTFTSASSYFFRLLTASLAQATPDLISKMPQPHESSRADKGSSRRHRARVVSGSRADRSGG